MDAAFEVFSEVGIHAASVEMIAERADFTRGAFYSNFDTKEELFLALAERGNNERLALLRGSVANIDVILPTLVFAPPLAAHALIMQAKAHARNPFHITTAAY